MCASMCEHSNQQRDGYAVTWCLCSGLQSRPALPAQYWLHMPCSIADTASQHCRYRQINTQHAARMLQCSAPGEPGNKEEEEAGALAQHNVCRRVQRPATHLVMHGVRSSQNMRAARQQAKPAPGAGSCNQCLSRTGKHSRAVQWSNLASSAQQTIRMMPHQSSPSDTACFNGRLLMLYAVAPDNTVCPQTYSKQPS